VPTATPTAPAPERDASAYDVRPVHKETTEPTTKRTVATEINVGSSVKPYKSILG